jgi:hypothetical protein
MGASARDPKLPDQVTSSLEQVKSRRSSSDVSGTDEFASAAHDFSIVVGGPVYDFLLRIGLVRVGLPNVLRRVIALIALTWLPLLILSVKDGLALGHQVKVPFLYDFSMYGRFLLALPLFIVAEIVIDPAIRQAVKEFVDSRIVQEKELPQFEEVLRRTQRLRDSAIPELLLLGLAFFPVFLFQPAWGAGAAPNWHKLAHGLTSGGWWFATISSPLLRFVTYRWIFRYFIWALLLWRIIRLNLHLIPTHPDHTAGLGFLRHTQSRFGILFCALGCIFAGQVLDALVYDGVQLASFKFLMAGFLVLSIIAGLFPLMLLAPKMTQVRRAGLREYGKLGRQYTESFDLKWVHPAEPPSEPLLGTGDIQSLADLANSYAVIEQMSIAPVTKRLTVQLAVLAALPLIPVIIYGTPITELVKAILKMVT